MFKRIKIFFSDIKAEMIKVAWPTKQQTYRNTYVVFIFILLMSIFLGILNVIFGQIVQFVF